MADRGLVLAAVGLFTALPVVPLAVSFVLSAAIIGTLVAAFRGQAPQARHVTVFCAIAPPWLTLGRILPWPIPLLGALVTHAAVARFTPGLSDALAWLRAGRIDRVILALIGLTVVVSSVALVVWHTIARPDLSDLYAQMPQLSPLLLAATGLVFALFNAAAEEAVWRGILLEALLATLPDARVAVLVQAVSFGICHIQGFPRGLSGMVLAGIYGVMIGYIRVRSDGMLAPWVAHVFADITIFTILILLMSQGA
jgi:hypothetical protein